MKRNLILLIVIAAILATMFSGCGKSSGAAAEIFSARIKEVTEATPELADYSMGTLTDQGDGVYTADAYVGGKSIGTISITFSGNEVKEYRFTFANDGPKGYEYIQPSIATAMVIDSTLDYAAAKEVIDGLDFVHLFNDPPIVRNGYTYLEKDSDPGFSVVRIYK